MSKQAPFTIAIIPARGGSKRVVRKNLLSLAGHPLVGLSVLHARQSKYIDAVYVSTDDEEVGAIARAYGAEVIARPVELAHDEATSESALVHVLDERNRRGLSDPDLLVFLQCTSPVRRLGDIDGAIEKLVSESADSVFSACENNLLIWAVKDGKPYSLNYDFRRRQREQDMAVQYRENGSIYVLRPDVLRQHNNRLGGKIAVYEMDYWSSFQLDTPEHVDLLNWILRRPEYAPPIAWPDRIELVVFDFDGVMTDNTVAVTGTGEEAVRCHRGDGWGIARLREAGVRMLVLSTEANSVVAARCTKLRLPCCQNVGNKAAFLARFLSEDDINPAHVVYLANDVNDLGCLNLVGIPVVVADAHRDAVAAAKLVLSRPGGQGAVRELCDLLLAHLAQRSGGRA